MANLYEKLYEDNAEGKVTDEWFTHMSHKYELERTELKGKISDLRHRLSNAQETSKGKDMFLNEVRSFMEMETLTAPLAKELSALKQAMNDYTKKDKENYGDTDITKMAYPKFLEELSICEGIFHGFNYEGFYAESKLAKAQAITDGANFLLDIEKEDGKDEYLKHALALKKSLSLCASMVEKDMRLEAAYFEAVRTMIVRITMETGDDTPDYSYYEINARINELLKASIESSGVEKLTVEKKDTFSLFDPKFLAELQKMKQKNVALEILRKLIDGQIKVFMKTNVVKSEKFKELYQRTINSYLNGHKTSLEVFQELLAMAEQLKKEQEAGNELGLNSEELAFYDALTKPSAIKGKTDKAFLEKLSRVPILLL